MICKFIIETIICAIVGIGIAYIISGAYLYFESLIKMKFRSWKVYQKKKYRYEIKALLEALDRKERR